MTTRVCVIGAGIAGLTSAYCIQNSIPNVKVTIVADKLSPNTTSDGSGGKWEPHLIHKSQENLIRKWGQLTFDYLLKLFLSPDAKDAGVQLMSGFNFRLDTPETQNPFWKDTVIAYRTLTEQEIKTFKPSAKGGVFFTTLILNSYKYLPWLMEKFQSKGGKIIKRKLNSINEVANDFDIIINCSGLGAYHLVGDKDVQPIRGHLTRVYAPWLKHFYQDKDNKDLILVLPGADGVVSVGGTNHVGNWDTSVHQEDKDRIWRGALNLVPSLKDARIIDDWVGLRPSRKTIRLELEELKSVSRPVMVIHNYGHSGSGITLCWGCAQDVVELCKEAIHKLSERKSKL